MQKDFIVVTLDSGNGDATVTVVASENIGNERSSALNVAGGSMTRTISVSQLAGGYSPVDAPNGVYIVHTNGRIYPRDKWDTSENNNAVGVGVKTSACSFVIAPVESRNFMTWGTYGVLVSGTTTTTEFEVAIKDYNGKANTDAIIAQLGTSGEYAALFCKNYTFKNGKQGYLPAEGEWHEAYQYKTEIDACMKLIGGESLGESFTSQNLYKWASTQKNEYSSWSIQWFMGLETAYDKAHNSPVWTRPFTTLV